MIQGISHALHADTETSGKGEGGMGLQRGPEAKEE